MLIACPTCGRLQFDMDTVVAEIEERLRQYEDPIEVAVLGCAVNGIGEASHADFGITGAKNEGLIFAHGKPIRKVPQDQLVDALFAEIDKSIDRGTVEVDEREAAEGAEWLERIEEENAGEMTPERIAALEARPPPARGTASRCRWPARRRRSASRSTRTPRPPPGAASRGPRRPATPRRPGRWRCIARSSTASRASTTVGSNCVPAQRRSSATASSSLTGSR